ncbi:DUF5366 family protein [Peribacillus sp. SCS-26]|uniref:DUF5366 family protein n=1 Tax=Paraperibacillus marinus TaxID=3115295 RepID=UPI003905AE7C
MREFFSAAGIRLSLLVLFLLIFFMLFSALKLISATILELSLLFFSRDAEGNVLKNIRLSSVIYFGGGLLSLLSASWIPGIAIIFGGTTLTAFIYLVYKTSPSMTITGLFGMIFFHTLCWSTLLLGAAFLLLKLYNSLAASLPL